MLNLMTMGADSAPKNQPINSALARKTLIADLAQASLACKKAGIDLSRPVVKASLVAAGGSAMALAAQVGTAKTLSCLHIFTAIADKHRPYILHLGRDYREAIAFGRELRRGLGPIPRGTKAIASVSATVGAWGSLMAMGALGAAAFFIVRAIATRNTSAEEMLEAAPAQAWTDVKLKDAAGKKYIPAKMAVARDSNGKTLTVYTGILNGKEFKIETTPDKTPVWSGLRWTPMPHSEAAKVAMAGSIKGIGRGNLADKDAVGIESCGIDSIMGSLEELVGAAAVTRKKAAAKGRRIAARKRPAGSTRPGAVRPVRPPRNNIMPLEAPSPLVITPGLTSPMNARLDSSTVEILNIINQGWPASIRANTAAVTHRRLPTMWPGARGNYSY